MTNRPLNLTTPKQTKRTLFLTCFSLLRYIQNTESFTAEDIITLKLWSKTTTNIYIRILRDIKVIYVSGWIPPKKRGNPVKIYSYGNKQDVKYIPIIDERRVSRAKQTSLSEINRTVSNGAAWFPR